MLLNGWISKGDVTGVAVGREEEVSRGKKADASSCASSPVAGGGRWLLYAGCGGQAVKNIRAYCRAWMWGRGQR